MALTKNKGTIIYASFMRLALGLLSNVINYFFGALKYKLNLGAVKLKPMYKGYNKNHNKILLSHQL